MMRVPEIGAILALGPPSGAAAESARDGGLGSEFWGAILLGIVALCLLLPATTRRRQFVGTLLGVLSLLLITTDLLVPLVPRSAAVVFWGLAVVTVVASVAAIATPKPVHTALWFALSLLGTAGLLLFDGAQFLSVSTAAVYAGAIVVTFLFVLMLAQPEGHAVYDRISWSWYNKMAAALVAAGLLGVLTVALQVGLAHQRDMTVEPGTVVAREVLAEAHVARFGAELYTRHLVSIEVAGALLLIALVGTLSIMTRTAGAADQVPRGTAS
ncbi:MAG: NADH-quinone oxidoreductase subunit J [Pirellulaceae bacterium]|nr:NADH-quinone oxidoreductase subunit J [Pirellulaceae bacterium]